MDSRVLVPTLALLITLAVLPLPLPAADPAPAPAAPVPRLAQFVGAWEGKWDGIWTARFTVVPSTTDTNQVKVLYEWEEHVGQPMKSKHLPGKITASSLLVGTHIYLDLSDAGTNVLRATGKFAEKRTADLRRVEGK